MNKTIKKISSDLVLKVELFINEHSIMSIIIGVLIITILYLVTCFYSY